MATPRFARLRRLRSVAPLALQNWHGQPVARLQRSVIAGLNGLLFAPPWGEVGEGDGGAVAGEEQR